ncbi:cupin domain-containing protein [Kineosporia sp. R_H_3]|uniref:cupin domain-containing protein n=1 Tax=Kineosporia sp. R_H_3 TaxID=1961848 RepID=UPI0018EA202E|nr:cupin domain-containing protein [Kineosporia sp. R_H_3]
MFTDIARVVRAAALPDADLEADPLDPAKVVSGEPEVRVLALHDAGVHDGPGGGGVAVGVWQHSAGVSRDVEADEIFVVLSGRATVEVEGGPTLEIGPGDVGLLPAGARTTWTVHETLRKVYVVA